MQKLNNSPIVALYYTLPQVAVLCSMSNDRIEHLIRKFGVEGRRSGTTTLFTTEQVRQIRVLSDLASKSKDDLVALIIANTFSQSFKSIA